MFAEFPVALKVIFPLIVGSAVANASVGDWLANLAFLLGIAVALKHLLAKKTELPQPVTVAQKKTLAEQEELRLLDSEMHRLFELERKNEREELAQIHKRIDQVATSAAATAAKLKSVDSTLGKILDKLI